MKIVSCYCFEEIKKEVMKETMPNGFCFPDEVDIFIDKRDKGFDIEFMKSTKSGMRMDFYRSSTYGKYTNIKYCPYCGKKIEVE